MVILRVGFTEVLFAFNFAITVSPKKKTIKTNHTIHLIPLIPSLSHFHYLTLFNHETNIPGK